MCRIELLCCVCRLSWVGRCLRCESRCARLRLTCLSFSVRVVANSWAAHRNIHASHHHSGRGEEHGVSFLLQPSTVRGGDLGHSRSQALQPHERLPASQGEGGALAVWCRVAQGFQLGLILWGRLSVRRFDRLCRWNIIHV